MQCKYYYEFIDVANKEKNLCIVEYYIRFSDVCTVIYNNVIHV